MSQTNIADQLVGALASADQSFRNCLAVAAHTNNRQTLGACMIRLSTMADVSEDDLLRAVSNQSLAERLSIELAPEILRVQ